MLFNVFFSAPQYIGNGNGDRIGKRIGNAKGMGTSVAQTQRNKANAKRIVKCPNHDICDFDAPYSDASRKFKPHFLDPEAVEMGCLAKLDALTPVEWKSTQWKAFVKYHPKYSVAKV